MTLMANKLCNTGRVYNDPPFVCKEMEMVEKLKVGRNLIIQNIYHN